MQFNNMLELRNEVTAERVRQKDKKLIVFPVEFKMAVVEYMQSIRCQYSTKKVAEYCGLSSVLVLWLRKYSTKKGIPTSFDFKTAQQVKSSLNLQRRISARDAQRVTFSPLFIQAVVSFTCSKNNTRSLSSLTKYWKLSSLHKWMRIHAPEYVSPFKQTVPTKVIGGNIIDQLQNQKQELLNKISLITQCEKLGLQTTI